MKNTCTDRFKRIRPDSGGEDLTAEQLVEYCLDWLNQDDGHELNDFLTSHSTRPARTSSGHPCLQMVSYEELIGTLNVVRLTLAKLRKLDELRKDQVPEPAVTTKAQLQAAGWDDLAGAAQINVIHASQNVDFYMKKAKDAQRRHKLARKLSAKLNR